MTLLLENPVPAMIVGGLTAAILGGGWLQTGRKWLLYLMVAAILLTVGAVVLERTVETDREQITATLHQIAALVERNEVDAAAAYAYSGTPEVRSAAEAELSLYEFSDVDIKRNLEIQVYPDERPPRALAEFNVTAQLTTRSGQVRITDSRIPRYVEVTFYQEEDGAWRVGGYAHYEPTYGYRIDEPPRGSNEAFPNE
jgi:hypothetical protein